jgi:hypothetical protein
LHPPSITINDTDSVSKQLKDLAKHLIGVSIPDFIHVLNQVVTRHPTNKLKILVDHHKDNLEKALLAEDYDINKQRELMGKKLATATTRKRLSFTALIKEFLPESPDKQEKKKRKKVEKEVIPPIDETIAKIEDKETLKGFEFYK